MTGCALRPPELDIEGCTIRTSYDTVGRVETITPFRGDQGWMLRPLAPGWTIEYRDQRGDLCYINEVFVEDGQIYAHPWRDRIEVVQQVARQMRMF